MTRLGGSGLCLVPNPDGRISSAEVTAATGDEANLVLSIGYDAYPNADADCRCVFTATASVSVRSSLEDIAEQLSNRSTGYTELSVVSDDPVSLRCLVIRDRGALKLAVGLGYLNDGLAALKARLEQPVLRLRRGTTS